MNRLALAFTAITLGALALPVAAHKDGHDGYRVYFGNSGYYHPINNHYWDRRDYNRDYWKHPSQRRYWKHHNKHKKAYRRGYRQGYNEGYKQSRRNIYHNDFNRRNHRLIKQHRHNRHCLH